MVPMLLRAVASAVFVSAGAVGPFSGVSALAAGLPAAADAPPADDAAAVRGYVRLLHDDDPVVRKRAAVALQRLGTKAKEAVPALEKALLDPDDGVRKAAAAALEAVDPTGPPDKKGPAEPAVGAFAAGKDGPALLLRRGSKADDWKRVADGADVFAGDRLMSLPGSSSAVRLGDGVRLELHGHVREFTVPQPGFEVPDLLQESAVTLNRPEAPFDADLTLDRGRVYLTNRKKEGAARVRLRFAQEVWDLTLAEPDAEVGVDLMKVYVSDLNWKDGEEPFQMFYLNVLKGKAGLVIDAGRAFPNLQGPLGPCLVIWDNRGKGVEGPIKVEKPLPVWDKRPAADGPPDFRDRVARMREALVRLNTRLDGNGSVEAALAGGLPSDKPADRLLSIYSLGAVGAAGRLLDVLADEDKDHAADRDAAVFTLRRWLARDADNGKRLFDHKTKSGLLTDKKYRPSEAEDVLDLLHDLPDAAVKQPETYARVGAHLNHDQMAIRQLAWWQLQRLAPGVKSPAYDPAGEPKQRQAAADWWVRQAEAGKLPPPPPGGK
jgi:hypothetical protein